MPWCHCKGRDGTAIHFLPKFIPPFIPVIGYLVRLCLPKRHTSFPSLLAGLRSYMTEFLPPGYKQGHCKAACGTFPGKAAGTCIHRSFWFFILSCCVGCETTIWVHEKKGLTLRTVAHKLQGGWVTEDLMEEVTCPSP